MEEENELLVEIRRLLKLTQRNAAQVFGVKPSSWQRWEMGVRPVPRYIAKSILYFSLMSENKQRECLQDVGVRIIGE